MRACQKVLCHVLDESNKSKTLNQIQQRNFNSFSKLFINKIINIANLPMAFAAEGATVLAATK